MPAAGTAVCVCRPWPEFRSSSRPEICNTYTAEHCLLASTKNILQEDIKQQNCWLCTLARTGRRATRPLLTSTGMSVRVKKRGDLLQTSKCSASRASSLRSLGSAGRSHSPSRRKFRIVAKCCRGHMKPSIPFSTFIECVWADIL